jgi:hypothetical protein
MKIFDWFLKPYRNKIVNETLRQIEGQIRSRTKLAFDYKNQYEFLDNLITYIAKLEAENESNSHCEKMIKEYMEELGLG